MTQVAMTDVDDLRRAAGDLKAPDDLGVELAARTYSAKLAPGSFDYRGLILECCKAAHPLTTTLFARGYQPWLMLVGAVFTSEKKRRYPNYSLAEPARNHDLIGDAFLEQTYRKGDAERTAGIYLTKLAKFPDACWFLAQNTWSIIVLSRRNDFLSSANLEGLFRSAAFDDTGMPTTPLNWLALSIGVCPTDDIVVKTIGEFDDRERDLCFIYASRNLLA